MKIAIPVNDKSLENGVCQSFGRAPYFLIHDIESKENTFLNNSAALSRGGAGVKAAQMIADNEVDALLTPRCGDNAAGILKVAKIKLYKTKGDSIEDNIKSFNEGKLSLLMDIHPGLHDHGGR